MSNRHTPKQTTRAERLRLCSALAATIAFIAPVSPAVGDDDHVAAKKLRAAGEILPLEKILERARAAKPGDVIETELERKHGRYVYEIEILDKAGQVWELKLDAKTGELIEVERDH